MGATFGHLPSHHGAVVVQTMEMELKQSDTGHDAGPLQDLQAAMNRKDQAAKFLDAQLPGMCRKLSRRQQKALTAYFTAVVEVEQSFTASCDRLADALVVVQADAERWETQAEMVLRKLQNELQIAPPTTH